MSDSEIKKKVEKYINSGSDNILIDIIYDTEVQTETYKILKYIFVNNIVQDMNKINEALYNAVRNGLYVVVKSLLKYGKAEPNYIHEGGFPMTDIACDFYYKLSAKVLYKYGG